MAPEGTAEVGRTSHPRMRPNRDYNTEEGRGRLERYQEAILQGLKGGPKTYEYGKPSKVIQGKLNHPLSSMKDCARPTDFIHQEIQRPLGLRW